MLVSVWGKRWREVQVAMFTAYLDDSGTSTIQPIAIGTAWLIPAAQILRLESQWQTFAHNFGFSDFHTSWCAARNYESDFANWDTTKQKKAFFKVRQFCKKFGIKVFSFAVKKTDYEQVIPEELRNGIGGHYAWAVRHVGKQLAEWKLKRGIKEPIEHVFDWEDINSPRRREIDIIMGQLEEMLGERVYHSFRERKKIPGLQCVDFLAWVSYQLAKETVMNEPMHPLADEALKDLERYREDERWFGVAFVTRPALEKWVRAEMAIGKAIPKLKEWQAKYPQRGKRAKKKRV